MICDRQNILEMRGGGGRWGGGKVGSIDDIDDMTLTIIPKGSPLN